MMVCVCMCKNPYMGFLVYVGDGGEGEFVCVCVYKERKKKRKHFCRLTKYLPSILSIKLKLIFRNHTTYS